MWRCETIFFFLLDENESIIILIPSINSFAEYSVGFNQPEDVRICSDSLRDILFGFFEFYSNFEFEDNIISPFTARNMDKNFMDPTKSLVQW